MKGLVLHGTNNFFTVQTEQGTTLRCSIKGKKLKEAAGAYNPLAPGDLVAIEQDPIQSGQGQILSLLERKNRFVRWNQKNASIQLLAANIDLVMCITSPANPPFRPRFIDRVLLQAHIEHIPAVIVVNKCDLKLSDSVRNRIEDWRRIGYTVYEVSSYTGQGIRELLSAVAGNVCMLTGQSGVGKSSMLNAFYPPLALKTARISYKYNRGTHTTTQGVFLSIPHTDTKGEKHTVHMIDTPGIRHFAVCGVRPDEVLYYFPEMEDAASQCRFGLSCSHEHEQGCKILEKVAAGLIHPDRYASWQLIKEELANR